jgi:hypothetical protein
MPGVQGNGRSLVISGVSIRNRQTWMLDGLPDDAAAGSYATPLYFETAATIGIGRSNRADAQRGLLPVPRSRPATTPSNNISNPGAGAFTAASIVPAYSPERQGARQVDAKIRLIW